MGCEKMGFLKKIRDIKISYLLTKMDEVDTKVLIDGPVNDCITLYDRLYETFKNSKFSDYLVEKNFILEWSTALFEFDRYCVTYQCMLSIDRNAGEDIEKQEALADALLKLYLSKIGEKYGKSIDALLQGLDVIHSNQDGLNYEERVQLLALQFFIKPDEEYIKSNSYCFDNFVDDEIKEILQLVSGVIDCQYNHNTSSPLFLMAFYKVFKKI